MAKSRPEPIIGVDLATTRISVAVNVEGKVETVINRNGNRITPSYVALTTGGILLGDEAKDYAILDPTSTVFDTKRLIGRNFEDPKVQEDIRKLGWPFEVTKSKQSSPKIIVHSDGSSKTTSPEEIIALLLTELKMRAEAQCKEVFKQPITKAVVTVPAYFGMQEKGATIKACQQAGLNVISIIPEPIAAVHAYITDTMSKRNILVFDLGGGTFDISIVTVDKGQINVKAIGGDIHLGGKDIDANIVKYIMEEYNINCNISKNKMRELFVACEKAKCTLSQIPESKIMVRNLLENGQHLSVTFYEYEIAKINNDILNTMLGLVQNCIKDAKMDAFDIDDIILVGGGSRDPLIKNRLKELLRRDVLVEINPDEVVAQGAAIYATSASRHVNLMNPYNLGVCVFGGKMATILKKNSQIPWEMTKLYHAVKDNQTKITVDVYEGESDSVEDNKHLGRLELGPLVPALRDKMQFRIKFKVDMDCKLFVSITELNGILRIDNKDFSAKMEKAKVRGQTWTLLQQLQDQYAKMEAFRKLQLAIMKYRRVDNQDIKSLCQAEEEWMKKNKDGRVIDYQIRTRKLQNECDLLMEKQEEHNSQRATPPES